MLEQLNNLVDHLNQLDKRASKWRDKSGRIEVGVDDYNQLAAVLEQKKVTRPYEISIEDYVAMIDQYIETVMSGLSFEQVAATD